MSRLIYCCVFVFVVISTYSIFWYFGPYDSGNFNKVKVGMSRRDVYSLLEVDLPKGDERFYTINYPTQFITRRVPALLEGRNYLEIEVHFHDSEMKCYRFGRLIDAGKDGRMSDEEVEELLTGTVERVFINKYPLFRYAGFKKE